MSDTKEVGRKRLSAVVCVWSWRATVHRSTCQAVLTPNPKGRLRCVGYWAGFESVFGISNVKRHCLLWGQEARSAPTQRALEQIWWKAGKQQIVTGGPQSTASSLSCIKTTPVPGFHAVMSLFMLPLASQHLVYQYPHSKLARSPRKRQARGSNTDIKCCFPGKWLHNQNKVTKAAELGYLFAKWETW